MRLYLTRQMRLIFRKILLARQLLHKQATANYARAEKRFPDYDHLFMTPGLLKSRFHSQHLPKKRSKAEPAERQGLSEYQEEAAICLAVYFTCVASSHRMAARSNSVKDVTPNFSFARAQ